MAKGLPIPTTRVRLSSRTALRGFLRKKKTVKKPLKQQPISPKPV